MFLKILEPCDFSRGRFRMELGKGFAFVERQKVLFKINSKEETLK